MVLVDLKMLICCNWVLRVFCLSKFCILGIIDVIIIYGKNKVINKYIEFLLEKFGFKKVIYGEEG